MIASLPASTGGNSNKYAVSLAPDTGALLNFSMDSSARLENADFSGLETGTKAITDQLAASRDKLKHLQNQEQLLETQCKINQIKKISDPNLDCSSVSSSSTSK